MDADTAATSTATRLFCLNDCQHVSVCDLTGVERFIVWAIRWRASAHDDAVFAADCLQDSFDRAGLRGAQPAFEQFVAAAREEPLHCPAAQRLGCWRLSALEAHSLHAIACLQAGVIGEAWTTLTRVCGIAQAGRALQPLQDLAAALARSGGAINRWKFDPAPGYAPS